MKYDQKKAWKLKIKKNIMEVWKMDGLFVYRFHRSKKNLWK